MIFGVRGVEMQFVLKVAAPRAMSRRANNEGRTAFCY